MPDVLLVNGGLDTVSVSLERVPLGTIAAFRKELRGLERELRKKWPVLSVDIEQSRRRIRNPHVPGTPIPPIPTFQLVIAYGLYKAGRMAEKLSKAKMTFVQSASEAAGKEIGADIGKHIKKFVKGWLTRRAKLLRSKSKRPAR